VILRMRKPPDSKILSSVQYAGRISLKHNAFKIERFLPMPESALGAGGRAFKSPLAVRFVGSLKDAGPRQKVAAVLSP
jgi:hypothetical protein